MSGPKTREAPGPALQQRAQATLEALVTAGESLLDGRDPEALPVEQILARAGASASSFYRRFRSKDRFLDHLHARFCDRVTAEMEAFSDPSRWRGRPLEDVAREGASAYLSFRRRHLDALVSFEILEGRHPHLLARRRRTDLAVLTRVGRCVSALRTRDGRGVRMERLALALDLVVSMVRGAADGARRAHVLRDMSDADLAEQLVAAVLGYLAG
jgi:AcrR family transcriptional regulator